jgi:hypothetical protein
VPIHFHRSLSSFPALVTTRGEDSLDHPYVACVALQEGQAAQPLQTNGDWTEVRERRLTVGAEEEAPLIGRRNYYDLSPASQFLLHLTEDLRPEHFNYSRDLLNDFRFFHTPLGEIAHAVRLGDIQASHAPSPASQHSALPDYEEDKEYDPNDDNSGPDYYVPASPTRRHTRLTGTRRRITVVSRRN